MGKHLARGPAAQPQANSVRELTNNVHVRCAALKHFVLKVYFERTLRVEGK